MWTWLGVNLQARAPGQKQVAKKRMCNFYWSSNNLFDWNKIVYKKNYQSRFLGANTDLGKQIIDNSKNPRKDNRSYCLKYSVSQFDKYAKFRDISTF